MEAWVEPKPDDPCPCGSGRKYKDCCGVEAPRQ
ncbi:MAG: SEC-C metal-binding domain-containing protein [Candidatus Hydrothermarchaeota archaeon]|nr:SEC-C domain-containing protein [Euryarchaeota archaeon]